MDELKISFFGRFTLSFGESVLEEDSHRAHKQWRLIKYLVLNRDRAVDRRELIDATFGYGAYFGESEKALNALNAMIHRARAALDTSGVPLKIVHSDGKYSVSLDKMVCIDSERFALLSDEIFSESDLETITQKAMEALQIYGGFFLDGNYFDEKTRLLAEKYHRDYRRIFALVCGVLKKEGRFELLADIASRAVSVDPLCEDFYIEYIGALFSAGDVESAKSSYFSARAFFETRSDVILSSAFREMGELFEKDREAVVFISKAYADREKAVSDALSRVLDGVKVKISLI